MNANSTETGHFQAWFAFWIWVWLGTTLSGGLFGLVSLFIIPIISLRQDVITTLTHALGGAFFGAIFGLILAGTVGLFVIPSFGLLMYICFCNRRPYVLACVAGGLTGTLCVPPLCFLTAPIGSLGAYFYAKKFLDSPDSWLLREAEERRLENKHMPFNFTIANLFARTTVAAVLIAFWTFVMRYLFGFAFM